MKLKKITEFLDRKIPQDLALKNDKVGFMSDFNLTDEITSVKILMDLYPQNDCFKKDTLVITHHPPLFRPESTTFTVHSNWDIICGGANEALASQLDLKVTGYFDGATKIGRVCTANCEFNKLKTRILNEFGDVRVVNTPEGFVKKIGIISGFGLKNPDYIKLASDKNLDILISGDLTQESAVLAYNLGISLIDLEHHRSEVSGLYQLKKLINDEFDIDCEVIDINPIERINL